MEAIDSAYDLCTFVGVGMLGLGCEAAERSHSRHIEFADYELSR